MAIVISDAARLADRWRRAIPWQGRTGLYSALLLAGYAALVVLRMPQVVTRGRFWGEEGAVYFYNAWNRPWLDALFAIHTGYLNLSASIATLLSVYCVRVEDAPFVTTGFALLIQLVPPIMLMTSGVPWLRDRWAVTVAMLMMLATSASAEVWLNSITSQFHLGLCVALILAMPTVGGWVGRLRMGVLVAAPLSGPSTLILTPLFCLRAWLDRSRGRAAQAVVFAGAAGVQALMIVLHPQSERTIGIGLRLLAAVIYLKQVLLPLFGGDATMAMTHGLIEQVATGQPLWAPVGITAIATTLIILAAWSTHDSTTRWLLAGGGVVMTLSYCVALGPHIDLLHVRFGDRYAYIPGVLFGLTLFGIARTGPVWVRGVASVLVAWLIVVGLHDYFRIDPVFADGPSWASEVRKWRADPMYYIQLWPTEPYWRWPFGLPAQHGN